MNVDELARQIEYKVAPAPLIAVQGLSNTFAFEPEEFEVLKRVLISSSRR